jgi:hypothetical protein
MSQPDATPAEIAAIAPPSTGSLVFLAPKELRFLRHGAELRLTVGEDRSYLRVTVRRSFPLSDPARFLSVRDATGQEVGLIADPAALDAGNRSLVAEDLAWRYLVPVIERVLVAKERFGCVEWTVRTDRGERGFTTRNLRENVLRPSPRRVVINDVDGNRYDIPNLDRLDAASRERLLRYI